VGLTGAAGAARELETVLDVVTVVVAVVAAVLGGGESLFPPLHAAVLSRATSTRAVGTLR